MIYNRDKISLSGQVSPSVVFLGEGKPEVMLIDKILESLNAPVQDCVVFCLEGYKNLEKRIELILNEDNAENITSLGIMLDADDSPERRIRKVATALQRASFPSDENEFGQGRICQDGARRTGIFLCPGRGLQGQIETLIIEEIRTTSIFDCIMNYRDCVGRTGFRLNDKGLVQTYISARAGGLCGSAVAFQKGVLDINHEAYSAVRGFVSDLL